MAYNSNIPQPTDQLSVSQGDLLNNFQAIATIINPNTGSITFVDQVSAPTFPANQDGLYAITNGITAVSELYISKNIGSGGTRQIPLTASILSTSANTNISPGQNSKGWSYLPSGIIIQWGTVTVTPNATFSDTFPLTFPIQVIQVMISPQNTNNAVTMSNVYKTTQTTTGFSGYAGAIAGGTASVSWFAIGY